MSKAGERNRREEHRGGDVGEYALQLIVIDSVKFPDCVEILVFFRKF